MRESIHLSKRVGSLPALPSDALSSGFTRGLSSHLFRFVLSPSITSLIGYPAAAKGDALVVTAFFGVYIYSDSQYRFTLPRSTKSKNNRESREVLQNRNVTMYFSVFHSHINRTDLPAT